MSGTTSPIAVIGLALRVPGANSPAQFWRNLVAGVDSITREPAGQGAPAASGDAVRAIGRIDGIDLFDAHRFGIPPREAELIDPQQRLFLECSDEALEMAGHPRGLAAGAVGVVAGVGYNFYLHDNVGPRTDVAADQGQMALWMSNEKDHVATRVAYRLGLTGPAFTVQTSCSSSLVAIHLAARTLAVGDADLMIAGGAALDPPGTDGYRYDPRGIFSPDGFCRAFDEEAAGTVPGAGVAAVVLRRLDDALAAGDNIYAVIRGSGISNDGAAKVGYTAPGVDGQRRAIEAALTDAGLTAEQVHYVETHGTGTPLGDAIEVEALAEAYCRSDRPHPLAIGSLKPNLGHLDSAAGVASFIKVVLMMQHGTVPPSIHCARPRADIAGNAGLEVNRDLRPLAAAAYAGVSGFGLGGTNVHVIVGSADLPARPTGPGTGSVVLLPASAATHESAADLTGALAQNLDERDDLVLADVAHTLRFGREHQVHRSFAVARPDGPLSVGPFSAPVHAVKRPRIGLLFPGHGIQRPGMLGDLLSISPTAAKVVSACCAALPEHLAAQLRGYLEATSEPSPESTEIIQLAIFVTELTVARLLQERGVQPDVLLGHSLGEYAAACFAGVMDESAAMSLVLLRAELLGRTASGRMLAVDLGRATLVPLLGDDLDLAAENSERACVVSGPAGSIGLLAAELERRGVRHHRLAIEAAAHSRLLQPHLPEFRERAATVDFQAPTVPWLSSLTGSWVETAPDADYWTRQLRDPVAFARALHTFEASRRVAAEVGPGLTLSRLCQSVLPDVPTVPLMPDVSPGSPMSQSLTEGFGRLWALGAPDTLLAPLAAGAAGRLTALPTARGRSQSYWLSPTITEQPEPVTVSPSVPEAPATSSVPDGVREIWCRILGTTEASDDDNFFRAGGESLALGRLLAAFAERFGVELMLRDVVADASLKSMIRLVESRRR